MFLLPMQENRRGFPRAAKQVADSKAKNPEVAKPPGSKKIM